MTEFGQLRAILWAQSRSIWNHYPRISRGGLIFTAAGTFLWYGMCAAAAVGAAFLFASPSNTLLFQPILNGGLALAFLYFQVVPILLASSGVSLDLKKLLVYPIRPNHLFWVEVLLRTSVALEVVMLITGVAVGLALNRSIPLRGLIGLALFVTFNLSLSAGLRELLKRLLARRRVRELAILSLVLVAALPQLLVFSVPPQSLSRLSNSGWLAIAPWTTAADIALGSGRASSWAILCIWTLAAWWFGRWQFDRTLRFDEREAGATPSRPARSSGFFDWLLGWPLAAFSDPLGSLVEKELRFLSRAPRFRLVFMMGFSFGLLVWLPLAFGSRRGTFGAISENYLTFVSVYALLLLGEVSFYNVFGFDRGAAQAYYVFPVLFRTVLIAKNLAAVFFVVFEVTAVAIVCAMLGMPISAARIAEAYSVTAVLSLQMLAVGNLSSTHFPRAVDPAQSWRSGSMGRFHAMLLLIYPVLSVPILLAYLARYAFESAWAFYGVLALAAVIGWILYWVAMDTAVRAAGERKERILAALGEGQGPVAA